VSDPTFISRLEPGGTGIRLAVKDIIDMAGLPTTAGCRALADVAEPAVADAACLAGARAYGTDTGGSVRIPAACCGVAGLKTTWGRVPLEGVWPLSPSFDTVGPMARDVRGLIAGLELLEPGFAVASASPSRVGRLRVPADPLVDTAVDRVLAASGWDVIDIELPGWDAATTAAKLLLVAEAWAVDGWLVERYPGKVGEDVAARLRLGRDAGGAELAGARAIGDEWRAELDAAFLQVELVATPTLTIFPPTMARADDLLTARCTLPINLAGVPAVSLPAPAPGHLPASVQLIGPLGSEETLLAAGLVLEAAAN